ncbi:bifunctional DNA primase/polymerase [Streptomyces sp. NPDC090080]|uniref:bifunctional DNA primase/polymerase n=1 Tax=Streptomyces sp. NPDC090080 TaxID=3365939 RepID=UPI003800E9FD
MSAELRFPLSDRPREDLSSSVAPSSLDTAQWCARRGWPVHPLAPGRKTPTANCSDCRAAAHTPAQCPCLAAGRWCHGFHAATLNQERIRQWWGQHPELGIGVACGPAGLVVLDIDAHAAELPLRDRILPGIPIGEQVDLTGLANGYHSLGVLAALRGQQSPAHDASTLRVRTPSGGLHVWYRATDNRRWMSSVGSSRGRGRALAWQVDIRAYGSYIIAPGVATSNGVYRPIGEAREPAALPAWLAQELDRTGHLPAANVPAPRPVPPRAQQAVLAAGGGRGRDQRMLAFVLDSVAACGQVAEGAGFSDTLNRAAYTIGGLIAAGRITQTEAEDALNETASAARPGQEQRIAQIIRSGLAAGMKKPLYATERRS